MSRTSPVKGQVYTTLQIDNELELRDSPHLGFFNTDGEKDVVQDSHLAVNISALPGWAELRWTFIRETHEWIPIFQIVKEDEPKLMELIVGEHDDDAPVWFPKMPQGFDEKGRPISAYPDIVEVKEYAPKKYRMVDVKGQGTALDYSGEFTLQKLAGATNWSDEEFDRISELEVGEKIELDDGKLIVERVGT